MEAFTAETAAARSARLMQVAGEGWLAWVERVCVSIKDMADAARDLAACSNTGELFKLQRSWVETATERAAADLRTAFELLHAVSAAAGGVAGGGSRAFDAPVPAGAVEAVPVSVPAVREAAEPAAKPVRRPKVPSAGSAARRKPSTA